MCGIVGAVAERDVVPILMEGLRRLEYRGYDSAGLVTLGDDGELHRAREVGKVASLEEALGEQPIHGRLGIAHTRWATHGAPSERNAHPQFSGQDLALVHNGIIENHGPLRKALKEEDYRFLSETDTEVVAHRIHQHRLESQDLCSAVQTAVAELDGAYALAVMDRRDPDCIVTARQGCPVVIGIGIGEHFVASDIAALLPVTRRFIFLEEGDVAEIRRDQVRVFDAHGNAVQRKEIESQLSADAVERGEYRHYMLKEIHEQPNAVAETLEERLTRDRLLPAVFGPDAETLLPAVEGVHIIACGTSYHAGLIARYQIEQMAGIPCNVEIASEYRYREPVVPKNYLFVSISQSGETADTLAALRLAGKKPYLARLAICNVPESSLVRESDLVLMTRAGPEIGVASTKAFTTQLSALALLALALGKAGKRLDQAAEAAAVKELRALPAAIEDALGLNDEIEHLAEQLVHRHHALFLGRGAHYPVAMEGALKLKEISYIHAEAYAAGELKHGPLALVDEDMPIIAVAPNDALLEKIRSNLEEVRARGGSLIVFTDPETGFEADAHSQVITLPKAGGKLTAPALFTIPLQLLAYHVAVHKGTDVDKPRNLAKSVTVE
ncbi:glucosamine--fructose-6-phosphate aminotransferase (isomerizing) [Natronospira proteinivora]|uniref:Glutamine--fructose-6-phosphate aminotransferase [isomerizing] n=1 Tax=Natronospira proteinivora TaxID=1807133 RepID=A0ABT1GDA5_9GAMM|nr:glutamine--fructose-6-phosphate transaminase (isomerizing) [Natronospira proteinivora]MCP1728243.1 glucosamine--fructose-6-phosphate aminotransferase (isomerizing) [Natronospira proteinivora]